MTQNDNAVQAALKAEKIGESVLENLFDKTDESDFFAENSTDDNSLVAQTKQKEKVGERLTNITLNRMGLR